MRGKYKLMMVKSSGVLQAMKRRKEIRAKIYCWILCACVKRAIGMLGLGWGDSKSGKEISNLKDILYQDVIFQNEVAATRRTEWVLYQLSMTL